MRGHENFVDTSVRPRSPIALRSSSFILVTCFRPAAISSGPAPICNAAPAAKPSSRLHSGVISTGFACAHASRSEEHTSELQSHHDLVCRLLLEKKKRD